MRNKKKLLGAVAVAGILAASGSAFTGAGLASNAGPSTFVGGTVSQTVDGATLDSIHYNADQAGTTVTSVNLVFTDSAADNKTVSVKVDGTTTHSCTQDLDGQDVAISGHFTCSIGTAVGSLAVTVSDSGNVSHA